MENGHTTKKLTQAILLISLAGFAVPVLAFAPGLGYAIKPFLKNRSYRPSRIKKTFERLQKQELVSMKEQDDKVIIEITDKGKKKVLAYKFDEMRLKDEKWDGIWRVVIFDIPEEKREARDFLRRKLKDLNFYKLQKSVLVTPWNCKDEIDFIKHFYEVPAYVQLILAKKFDGEDKVRRYFNV